MRSGPCRPSRRRQRPPSRRRPASRQRPIRRIANERPDRSQMSGRAAHPVFALRDGSLHCESVPLEAIARRFGTPTFVYSRRAIVTAYRAYADALGGRPSLVCYAMKANSNLAILDLLARQGCGFDIVSGGELARALAVGADPQRIVFSGVGKTRGEIDAAL